MEKIKHCGSTSTMLRVAMMLIALLMVLFYQTALAWDCNLHGTSTLEQLLVDSGKHNGHGSAHHNHSKDNKANECCFTSCQVASKQLRSVTILPTQPIIYPTANPVLTVPRIWPRPNRLQAQLPMHQNYPPPPAYTLNCSFLI